MVQVDASLEATLPTESLDETPFSNEEAELDLCDREGLVASPISTQVDL